MCYVPHTVSTVAKMGMANQLCDGSQRVYLNRDEQGPLDCPYIWHAHAARARQQGISDEFVNALRDHQPLPALPADEQTAVHYALELFKTHKVSLATFQAALDQFGMLGLTELTNSHGLLTI